MRSFSTQQDNVRYSFGSFSNPRFMTSHKRSSLHLVYSSYTGNGEGNSEYAEKILEPCIKTFPKVFPFLLIALLQHSVTVYRWNIM